MIVTTKELRLKASKILKKVQQTGSVTVTYVVSRSQSLRR